MILLVLCSALLTLGAALECDVCYTTNAITCSGHYTKCDSSQNHCMMTLTQTTFGDVRVAVLEKSCGSVYQCTHTSSFSTVGYAVSVDSVCCDTDYCNNGTMIWKQQNKTLNGVTCPSCFAKNSKSCDPRATVNCKGDENHCIQFTVTKHRGDTIKFAGCASEGMGKSHGKAAFRGSSLDVTDFKYNNGQSLQNNPFIPLLTATTLTMIFLKR
ncbi:phospholipase A2 inhibitor and Ly6/PLAUR domain-containing protein-like isoform X2 [Bombina bombina]|uniref:phospholipase A2 inhibitor and Ly6/PLAUR domain-containing protein-like isoform X2 n=1 Tax=Bombina bombina TaxID=8345 RepID=UPI00235A66B8|nr:phospholipase A2 inhibitor and Ly6/PLAUR domain-containing protein-like isoform X2 [Bombina bombina]